MRFLLYLVMLFASYGLVSSQFLSAACNATVVEALAGLPCEKEVQATVTDPAAALACVGSIAYCSPEYMGYASKFNTLPATACPLCNEQFDTCKETLRAVVAVGLTSDNCDHDDQVLLAIGREQTSVACGVAAGTGNQPGTLFMPVMQCAMCGIVPCAPGLYCEKNKVPEICPAGYYCPNATTKLECPSGYYCPRKSLEPVKCDPGAACPAGSARQTHYIPFLAGVLILVVLGLLFRFLNKRRVGNAQHGASPSRRVSSSGASGAKHQGLLLELSEVSLTTKGVRRLQHFSGRFLPGQVTVIMGGSGAGKTTLLNVLLGKEEKTAGHILVDDGSGLKLVKRGLSAVRKLIGFVPQDDVMIRELTVRENLLQSAKIRLPKNLRSQAERIVDDLLERLELKHVKDSLIGDESVRGVSGGERKRTNVGMELAANPSVLIGDEVTTGLDSGSALRIVELMQRIAQDGLPVVLVLHQPRQEIFDLIDQVILLAPGGRSVYVGPKRSVEAYFEHLGFECPPETNPADFIMDTISGKVESTGETPMNVDGLAAYWQEHGVEWVTKHAEDGTITSAASAGGMEIKNTSDFKAPKRNFAPWLVQLWLAIRRSLVQRTRGNQSLVALVAHMLAGFIIGIVGSSDPLWMQNVPGYGPHCPPYTEGICGSSLRNVVGPFSFYLIMTIGIVGITVGVRTFGTERPVYWREVARGASKSAYLIGKMLADVPFFAISSFLFVGPLYMIAPLRGPIALYYVLCLLIEIVVAALAYMLTGIFTNPDNATIAGVIIAVVANLFGGTVPKLGTGAYWAYTRYGQRATAGIELYEGYGVSEATFDLILPKEMEGVSIAFDLVMLVVVAVVIDSIAFALFAYTRKRHMK